MSRTLFSYENLGSTAREFSRKCETPRCEISMLAMISPLLLINSIDVTILWSGLAKHGKEISCSRNLVAARDLYDARQTLYASSYENLVEKSVRHASGYYLAFSQQSALVVWSSLLYGRFGYRWQFGLEVMLLGTSTELLYVELG